MRPHVLAATLIAGLLVTCGDDDASLDAGAPGMDTVEGRGSDALDRAGAERALLSARDLGPDFRELDWQRDARDDHGPCGAPPIDEARAPRTVVGAALESEVLEVQISEEIRLYDDPADAAAVIDAARDAFDCRAASDELADGTRLTEVRDLTDALRADAAVGLAFESADLWRYEVVAEERGAIVTLLLVADPTVDPEVTPVDVAGLAMGKLEDV